MCSQRTGIIPWLLSPPYSLQRDHGLATVVLATTAGTLLLSATAGTRSRVMYSYYYCYYCCCVVRPPPLCVAPMQHVLCTAQCTRTSARAFNACRTPLAPSPVAASWHVHMCHMLSTRSDTHAPIPPPPPPNHPLLSPRPALPSLWCFVALSDPRVAWALYCIPLRKKEKALPACSDFISGE